MERMKPGEFNWIDLSASDIDGQTAFYEALFGWTHTDVPFASGAVYKMYALGGKTVAGGAQMSPALAAVGARTTWNTYVRSDDVDASAVLAEKLGGRITMPAMDVPGTGRMAAIADPAGAGIFIWKPAEPDPTTQYGPAGTYGWGQLNTRDPKGAGQFYTQLFGWELRRVEWEPWHPYWQVLVGGEGQAGISPLPESIPDSVPAFWRPNFMTDDIEATLARAVELGGRIVSPKAVIPDRIATAEVADPAGAIFTLLQPLAAM
jgi:predicted enzyme related to lactoylglutathione lyase